MIMTNAPTKNMLLLVRLLLLLLLLLLVLVVVENSHAVAAAAFQPAIVVSRAASSSSSSSFALFLAKKRGGKSSLRKTVGGGEGEGGAGGSSGMATTTSGRTGGTTNTRSYDIINWCPLPANQKQNMPSVDGKVALLDTELPTMKNSATNPTGAVSVVKFHGQTFCFQSSCPTCQIPLTKATILPAAIMEQKTSSGGSTDGGGGDGHARLVCDLCKSTYSLGTGLKLKDVASGAVPAGGILASVVKSVFSSNAENAKRPLKLYKLGEKANGQLVIAVD